MTEETKPRVSDADMLVRFQNSKKRPPCSDTLGMRLAALSQNEQWVRMEFDVPQMFANPTGAVQGGFTVPVSSADLTATSSGPNADYQAIAGGTTLSFSGTAGETRTVSVDSSGV